ncbi:inhibitor of growth protein 5-like [Watersipora subatra]|uniref:inhibitor of growth protein 5-like n=1 Tax=Watersipora subatra TaxID=2589382 RepID=UPI00355B2BFD
MAAAVYLEQHLDSLEALPLELQRNFNLMRDLDKRAQDVMKEIDKHADSYLATVKKLSSAERHKKLEQITKLFSRSSEYGDDKVTLAMQTYEMVDKHIRKLDNDLARFEAELKDTSLTIETPAPRAEKGKRGRKKKAEEEDVSKGQKRKKKDTKEAEPELPPLSPDFGAGHPSDVLDMPVDPNEPTYCICHQVSYGEMIGCDNNDCPIEWFHFPCVSLTSKPKGKWYCPRCIGERKKK